MIVRQFAAMAVVATGFLPVIVHDRDIAAIPIGRLEQATRGTVVQTAPPPPAPTTTVPRYSYPNFNVERWHDAAIQAGWAEHEWPVLACIIDGESWGNPDAYNGKGPDDSYGLLQVNLIWHRKWVGPLVDWDFSRLFDGPTNLRIGRQIFIDAGYSWRPWSTRKGCT